MLLRSGPASLIAIGGFSGSGKSTLAHALAPSIGSVPGALVIRSDEIRKRLCGVDPLTHLDSAGYTTQVTHRVYEIAADRAATIVRGGHSAIVDAVFARRADREAIERTAEAAGVPFLGLWLEAPKHVLADRSRRRQADPSDADAAVVRAQVREGAGEIKWRCIQTSAQPADVLRAAVTAIDARFKHQEELAGTKD